MQFEHTFFEFLSLSLILLLEVEVRALKIVELAHKFSSLRSCQIELPFLTLLSGYVVLILGTLGWIRSNGRVKRLHLLILSEESRRIRRLLGGLELDMASRAQQLWLGHATPECVVVLLVVSHALRYVSNVLINTRCWYVRIIDELFTAKDILVCILGHHSVGFEIRFYLRQDRCHLMMTWLNFLDLLIRLLFR